MTNPSPRARREHGIFLVWMAIMVVTLMTTAAFAIEWHNLSRIGIRMQKAADAAALAGVVYMPDSFDTDGTPNTAGDDDAVGRALEVAALNGFVDGQNDTTVTVSVGEFPTQLLVAIERRNVANVFGNLLDKQAVVRHAVAEYNQPLAMGSPNHQYGNDPESTDATGNPDGGFPNVWGSVGGSDQGKNAGEPVSPAVCHQPGGFWPIGTFPDNCKAPGAVNRDYSPDGYFYSITVPTGSSGNLVVQVMDPGWVGNNACAASSLGGANTLANNFNPVALPGGDPKGPGYQATRYASGGATRFCTGDQAFTGSGIRPPWATWRVRGPDDSPGDATNNPTIDACNTQIPGRSTEVESKTIKDMLLETSPAAPGVAGVDGNDVRIPLVASYFRQWYTLCTIPNAQPGTYFIQVQTKSKLDGGLAPLGDGHNRFSLRAGLGAPTSNNVQVQGWGRMSLAFLVPAGSAGSQFYLTRLEPSKRPRELVLSFYDVGDTLAAAGTLQVLRVRDDGTEVGFAGCTYTDPHRDPIQVGPPWGTPTPTPGLCSMDGIKLDYTSRGWDAKWVSVVIPIPAEPGYTCDETNPTKCWTKVKFTYPDGAGDTTVWTASIRGNPVRIAE